MNRIEHNEEKIKQIIRSCEDEYSDPPLGRYECEEAMKAYGRYLVARETQPLRERLNKLERLLEQSTSNRAA